MEGDWFDNLARNLAKSSSRRTLLRGLAGGATAGFAALVARSGADARRVTQASCGNEECAAEPSACNDGCVCCSWGNGNSRCMPPGQCAGSVACPEGLQYCGRRGCVECCHDGDCDDGAACTTDTCVDGQCVHTPLICESGDACIAATCDPNSGCVLTPVAEGLPGDCGEDKVCCSGGCVALGTGENCGFCGDACVGTGVTCGAVTPGVCGCRDDGLACGDAVCGMATNNCGETVACGPAGGDCPFNQTCTGGSCGCPSGYELLNEACFRINTPGDACSGCDTGIDGAVFGSSADTICFDMPHTLCDAGTCPTGQVCYPAIQQCLVPC